LLSRAFDLTLTALQDTLKDDGASDGNNEEASGTDGPRDDIKKGMEKHKRKREEEEESWDEEEEDDNSKEQEDESSGYKPSESDEGELQEDVTKRKGPSHKAATEGNELQNQTDNDFDSDADDFQ